MSFNTWVATAQIWKKNYTTLETIVCICPGCTSVLLLKCFPFPTGVMYNVYLSVLVSPSSCWMQFRDRFEWNYRRYLVFGEGTNSWIGWWPCALREINQSTVWKHLALLYAACLTDSRDTWKPSERAQCKSHCCSTGPCIMQEALSLPLPPALR